MSGNKKRKIMSQAVKAVIQAVKPKGPTLSSLSRKIKSLEQQEDKRFETNHFPNVNLTQGSEQIQSFRMDEIVKGDDNNMRVGDQIKLKGLSWKFIIQGGLNLTTDVLVIREVLVFDRTPDYGVGAPFDPAPLTNAQLYDASPFTTSSFNSDNVGAGKRFQVVSDRLLRMDSLLNLSAANSEWVSFRSSGSHKTKKKLDYVEDATLIPGDYPTNGIYVLTYSFHYPGFAGGDSLSFYGSLKQDWTA